MKAARNGSVRNRGVNVRVNLQAPTTFDQGEGAFSSQHDERRAESAVYSNQELEV